MRQILLVSKDDVLKDQLTRSLEDKKAKVDWARTFPLAMSLSTELQYDVALLEVQRFDSSALEFTREFLAQSPQRSRRKSQEIGRAHV